MPTDKPANPRQYTGRMVSSSFTDLEQHREALIKAIDAQNLKAVAMAPDLARPVGAVIESTPEQLGDGSARVAVISHRYGRIPGCPTRDPKQTPGIGQPSLLVLDD
ncbi:MAG: DUF4062 domain-containing protein [Planctomycetes bacterium]|nr:DUF4062 domain-containing protein [Planctomycetota bacterium]